jgi:hypothetical protein
MVANGGYSKPLPLGRRARSPVRKVLIVSLILLLVARQFIISTKNFGNLLTSYYYSSASTTANARVRVNYNYSIGNSNSSAAAGDGSRINEIPEDMLHHSALALASSLSDND